MLESDIKKYIQKGEVIVIRSDISFDIRNTRIREYFLPYPNTYIYTKEKVTIDDVRYVTESIQKQTPQQVHGVNTVSILICDDIGITAQHALLKVFEDIQSDSCILIYVTKQTALLSTILSRVISIEEDLQENTAIVDRYNTWSIEGKTKKERFDIIKKIIDAYEDENITKQDIISYVKYIQQGNEYALQLSMLTQPSVSVKYVLEYILLT